MKNRTFSYSQLNTFKTCPQQYKIIYLDGIRKDHESIEAFMGKRVHEVLEWLYNNENKDKSFIIFDKLCQIYDEQWSGKWHNHIYIADNTKNSDYYYSIGKRCLSNYYNKYGPSFKQHVVDTEVKLEFSIKGYLFKGVIDRLDNSKEGDWSVHDYKTSKRSKTSRQAKNDLQLALYHLAIEQNYGDVQRISLNWHFLRDGSKVSITHSKEEIEQLKKKIINIIKNISEHSLDYNNFLPKETLLCNWCYYWQECTAKIGENPVKHAD